MKDKRQAKTKYQYMQGTRIWIEQQRYLFGYWRADYFIFDIVVKGRDDSNEIYVYKERWLHAVREWEQKRNITYN